MKKIISFVLLVAGVLFFDSCSSGEKNKEIEFWTLQLSPAFNNYFNNLISEYETLHPGIKIKWVDIPYDAAIRKLLAAAAAGNPPDVVNLSGDFLAKFSGMDFLADFSKYLPQDSLNIFLPNALSDCVYNGKTIALPWYLNTYVLIYNKDYFKKAGFTEDDVPRTFDQLVEITREYKKRTGKYALFWNIGKDSYLPMMLGSEGLDMTNPEMTEARFNSPGAVEKIDKWIQLYREGFLQSESIIKPGSSIIEPYQSGQVAMVFTGPVFLNRIKENAPSIYSSTDIAPAVTGKTGKHELAVMTLSVTSGSKNIPEAVDFVYYVLNKKNQVDFSKISTTFPSVTDGLQDPYFRNNDKSIESRGRMTGAAELPDAVRLRKYLVHPQFDLLRDAFDEAIQKAALNKMTTQQALDEAAAKWNSILNKKVK